MIALVVVVGAALWLACGAVAGAANFAYFQRKYPEFAVEEYVSDRRTAFVMGLIFGPVALLVEWMSNGFRYGLKWR